jgi:hypothetical protein
VATTSNVRSERPTSMERLSAASSSTSSDLPFMRPPARRPMASAP